MKRGPSEHDGEAAKKVKGPDKEDLEEGECSDDEMDFKARASMIWAIQLEKPPQSRVVQSPLRYACEHGRPIQGLWMEFGVFSGKTINLMSNYCPKGNFVYGFDTFEGLPEAWRDKFEKGHFDRGGSFPKVSDNVKLIKGLFQDTLEPFCKDHASDDEMTLSVCHLDADLYSATIYVLNVLAPRIVPGTLLVFDELINYEGYKDHEWKALLEACEQYGWTFEWIAQSGPLEDPAPPSERWEIQQVALRITGVGKHDVVANKMINSK